MFGMGIGILRIEPALSIYSLPYLSVYADAFSFILFSNMFHLEEKKNSFVLIMYYLILEFWFLLVGNVCK